MSAHMINKRAVSTGVLRPDHLTVLIAIYQDFKGLPITAEADAATIAVLDADARDMNNTAAKLVEPLPIEPPGSTPDTTTTTDLGPAIGEDLLEPPAEPAPAQDPTRAAMLDAARSAPGYGDDGERSR